MPRPFFLLLLLPVAWPLACRTPSPQKTPPPAAPPQTDAPTAATTRVTESTAFRGAAKFERLCKKAIAENWASLPLGQRTTRVARAINGTPYVNWTLEIDSHRESPSVNFLGMDCWTFYETSLAFARMIRNRPAPWSSDDLLAYIELERYRNGHCDGSYLSRMHFLEEVFHDNQRRGLSRNITRQLPGATRLRRNIRDMSADWRSYRYMRANPSLVPGIAAMEKRVSRLPVYHVPKKYARRAEASLQSGDIIAITSTWHGSYTSHVGLAVKQADGTVRFMHATSQRSKGRRVIIDRRLSTYLNESSSRAGFIVSRPLPIRQRTASAR